jgi:hypothetical protein
VLGEQYLDIKGRALEILGEYAKDPCVMVFNAEEKKVQFKTELLIPKKRTSKPRIMLLFSNPHPHSIQQGMFLSPNTQKGENLFWPIMEQAGWFELPEQRSSPEELRDAFLGVKYSAPFELLFCCYYAFPTPMPEQIKEIFGKEFFDRHIQEEARTEFAERVRETSIEGIVTFNKSIFNLTTGQKLERYISELKKGAMVDGSVHDNTKSIPVFLTYPTGWRYHPDYKELRVKNLKQIKDRIVGKTSS